MKRFTPMVLIASVALAFGPSVYAQNYPKSQPKPSKSASGNPEDSSAKPSKTPKKSASPAASATPEASATPDKPTGPLKMIKTDGRNKESPIKVTELNYYDAGFGAKFNSEIRVSCKIQNTSTTDELKKVTLSLQVVNGSGDVLQQWKQTIGTLKPGQQSNFNPGVWYNTLGIPLQGKVVVEHEEVPKKKLK